MKDSRDDLFTGLPHVSLTALPTPLKYECDIPGGQSLYLKRDDLTQLGMGGNKVRKLEYLVGDAIDQGCNLLVTVGAAQSNHARLTAAAGARVGLPVHLILGGGRAARSQGNQLLARLFGARLHPFDTQNWSELTLQMHELCDVWRTQGLQPYVVPIGGSTPVGVMGFIAAWAELLAQLDRKEIRTSLVVHASSSGGTHAGLLAGRALFGGPPILAVGVVKILDDLAETTFRLANEALSLLGSNKRVTYDDVNILGTYQGSDYGVPTEAADDAIRWGGRRGLVFDRVYTAKALSGLLGEAASGRLPEGNLIFWHTGGYPSVFADDGLPDVLDDALAATGAADSSNRRLEEA